MRTLILTFLLIVPAWAGVPFTTKDHVKARGVALSFMLPDGMKKGPAIDSDVGIWHAQAQGVDLFITLKMWKHHLHTHGEKLQQLAENEHHPFDLKVQSKRLKVGHEPALLVEYRTPDEDITDSNHCVELWLHPGDTTVYFCGHIFQNGTSADTMSDAVKIWVPMLIKMFENTTLDD